MNDESKAPSLPECDSERMFKTLVDAEVYLRGLRLMTTAFAGYLPGGTGADKDFEAIRKLCHEIQAWLEGQIAAFRLAERVNENDPQRKGTEPYGPTVH